MTSLFQVVTGRNRTDLLVLRDMVPDTMYMLQVTAVNDNGESVTLRGRARTPPVNVELILIVCYFLDYALLNTFFT